WDGAGDVTPEPTVVSSKRRAALDSDDLFGEDELTSPGKKGRSVAPPTSSRASVRRNEEDDDAFDDDDDDLNTAEALLKGRVALWAVGASKRMKDASEQVASASRSVAFMVSGLLSKPARKPAPERRGAAPRGTRSLRPVAPNATKGRVHGSRSGAPQNGRNSGGSRGGATFD